MNGLLLMGHQDGAFVIKDNRAMPVMTKQGFGVLRRAEGQRAAAQRAGGQRAGGAESGRAESGRADAGRSPAKADTADIIAGTYTGLQNLRYKGGRLTEGSKISDLYEDRCPESRKRSQEPFGRRTRTVEYLRYPCRRDALSITPRPTGCHPT